METEEQIKENLLKDGNCYSGIGVAGKDGYGFTISSNPDGFEHSDPDERDFFMMTGLMGAVKYVLTFQEQIVNLKY